MTPPSCPNLALCTEIIFHFPHSKIFYMIQLHFSRKISFWNVFYIWFFEFLNARHLSRTLTHWFLSLLSLLGCPPPSFIFSQAQKMCGDLLYFLFWLQLNSAGIFQVGTKRISIKTHSQTSHKAREERKSYLWEFFLWT